MGLAIIGSSDSGGHLANSSISSQKPTQLGLIEGHGQQNSETFGSWIDKRSEGSLSLDSQHRTSLFRPSITLPSLKGHSLQPATSSAHLPFFEVKGEEDSWSCHSETLGRIKVNFSPRRAKKPHATLGPLSSMLLKFLPKDYEQDCAFSVQKELGYFEQGRALLQSLTWLKKSLDDDNGNAFVFYIHHQIPPLRAASKLTPRSVTLTLGWSQDGTVDIADGTEVFLDGILTYLHRDAPIVKLTDIIVKPYVRHDRPDGHAYCLPGAIKPVIPKDWHSNVYFQSDCNCGNGKETGCEFEIAHLDTKGAYPCSPILPDWDTAREEVLGFFAELAFSDDESIQ